MSKLIFQADDVRRVVEHTIAAKEQRPIAYTENKVKQPAVLLVHDQGVYLMSNGKPGDMIHRRKNGKSLESHYVAYARGCNPNVGTFDEWWETSREIVGGDDFAETLEWADEMKRMLDNGATHFVIDVDPQNLRLSAKYGRRKYARS